MQGQILRIELLMENKMEIAITDYLGYILGLYRGYNGYILGLYWNYIAAGIRTSPVTYHSHADAGALLSRAQVSGTEPGQHEHTLNHFCRSWIAG